MADQFVTAYANGKSGTVVTVSAAWAKARRLTVVKGQDAVDKFGVPLPPRPAAAPATKKAAPSRSRAPKTTTRKRTTSKASESSNGGNTTTVAAATPEEASK